MLELARISQAPPRNRYLCPAPATAEAAAIVRVIATWDGRDVIASGRLDGAELPPRGCRDVASRECNCYTARRMSIGLSTICY
jgi:hypothetical protein